MRVHFCPWHDRDLKRQYSLAPPWRLHFYFKSGWELAFAFRPGDRIQGYNFRKRFWSNRWHFIYLSPPGV